MDDKNVKLAKKELIQFLKKNNAVAVYFWTIYGYKANSKVVKETLTKIKYETRPKQLCELYEDLLGKLRDNPNIKDKKYQDNETLFFVYKNWCKYIRNKFHCTNEAEKEYIKEEIAYWKAEKNGNDKKQYLI